MNKLTNFLKRLRLRQIVTIFLAGVLLVISTACSGANAQGANPNNPAVQAGGANNPYKGGGDSYTKYNFSTDPKVTDEAKSQGNHSSLNIKFNNLVAATYNQKSEALYPGAETPVGRAYKEAELPIKTAKDFEQPEPGGLIQRNPDIGERVSKRLEAVKDTFTEASEFMKEKADEASARPEMQKNPAVGK